VKKSLESVLWISRNAEAWKKTFQIWAGWPIQPSYTFLLAQQQQSSSQSMIKQHNVPGGI